MGLFNWFKKKKEEEAPKSLGTSKSGKFEMVIAKPVYVTLIKENGKWYPKSKIEGTDSWWNLMETTGHSREGRHFQGFTDYNEAKEVALQYSKMLKIPFKK